MMINFITEWGKLTGIAGITLGVIILLFKVPISKLIFPVLTKRQSFFIIMTVVIVVFLLSLCSIVLSNKKTTQLSIFVTDLKGNVVLENEGKINIHLGNRALNEIIGANGRVNFPDIAVGSIGDTILIGLHAPGWEIVDGNNTFVFTGTPIHLKIKKDNSLGLIRGIVKSRDGQKFIEKALVRINTDTAIYTDSLGIFKILLPDNMQIKNEIESYLLTVSKQGYELKTQYYSPKSSDAEIRLVLK